MLLKIVLHENVMNSCWSLVSNSWNALTRAKIGDLVTHLIQSVFRIPLTVLAIIVCSRSSGVLNSQNYLTFPDLLQVHRFIALIDEIHRTGNCVFIDANNFEILFEHPDTYILQHFQLCFYQKQKMQR